MAKHFIKQIWANGSTTTTTVAADLAGAQSIATNILFDTEIGIYKESTAVPATEASATSVDSKFAEMVLRDGATGNTTYMTLHVKNTVDVNTLKETFTGMVIDGITVDEVVVTKFSQLTAA